tara:strand:- start:112 stop:915 length:804 start_codon:yes stop_codon:yes gene_type:complete
MSYITSEDILKCVDLPSSCISNLNIFLKKSGISKEIFDKITNIPIYSKIGLTLSVNKKPHIFGWSQASYLNIPVIQVEDIKNKIPNDMIDSILVNLKSKQRIDYSNGGESDHINIEKGVLRHITAIPNGKWECIVRCNSLRFKTIQRWRSKSDKYGIIINYRMPPYLQPICEESDDDCFSEYIRIILNEEKVYFVGVLHPLDALETFSGKKFGWPRDRILSRLWDIIVRSSLDIRDPFNGSKDKFLEEITSSKFKKKVRQPCRTWLI